jgi:hypothetical protein
MLLSLANLDRMMSLMLTYSDKRARGLGQISNRGVRERRGEYGFFTVDRSDSSEQEEETKVKKVEDNTA